jgi:NADH:ubiquinone oxidoreductase subunit 6 (subunit J)
LKSFYRINPLNVGSVFIVLALCAIAVFFLAARFSFLASSSLLVRIGFVIVTAVFVIQAVREIRQRSRSDKGEPDSESEPPQIIY